MPYFDMSTGNPTGVRPWNFAMQNSNTGVARNSLGTLRRSNMGFYFRADYPLPANTLHGYLPRQPLMDTSSFSGKDPYGNPQPVYGPLNPNFYGAGLGRLRGGRLGVIIETNGNGSMLRRFIPPAGVNYRIATETPNMTAGGAPITVTATGQPLPTAAVNMTPQQQQAILAAQQQAAQNAVAAFQQQQAVAAQNASAAAVAASPSSQIATATTAPASTPSWLTDPTQSLISGIPNWGLVAAAGALLLLKGKR